MRRASSPWQTSFLPISAADAALACFGESEPGHSARGFLRSCPGSRIIDRRSFTWIWRNNKIFSDTIQNFTVNPYRRVDLVAQLDHSVDPAAATQLLKTALARIPNVLTDPRPDVELLTFTMAGPVLAVRPYCHNDHYWQVYFDTNRAIHDTFAGAGYPAPEQHFAMRTPIAMAAKAV